MQVAIIGDVHLADNPPSLRRETYMEEILAKLEFVVDYAIKANVVAIVQAGDLLHVKAPSRTSHALVQKTIDVLSSAVKLGIEVLIVPGNHDMQHDRIESLAKQPLGTVCKAPGISMLMGPHQSLPIFGIPYLYDFPTLLPGWMKKYRVWKLGLEEQFKFKNPLLVTHAPIFPPGDTPVYDFIDADDWARLMEDGDCYYGHIHGPHGAYGAGEYPDLTRFCNNGALSRGSLHEETLKRKPAFTVWDQEKQDEPFTRIEVPHKPVSEVFRLKEKEDADVKQGMVTQFLDGIEQTVLETLTVEEVVAHAEKMGLRARTLAELRECVDAVS